MTIRELLRSVSLTLQQAGCGTPRLDAELLLAKVLECDRTWLIAHVDADVPADAGKAYKVLVERRCRREPVAYITGEKEFWSRPFLVTPKVLIPRPETEHLIEAVIKYFPHTDRPYRFCDIGTGSGCIAVTLACEYPAAEIIATDVTGGALAIARKNSVRHHVASRIRFHEGDMYASLQADDGPFDAILCNPPYVSENEMKALAPELGYEPRCALTDEADGLTYLRQLIAESSHWLNADGCLIVETGCCGLPAPAGTLRLHQEIHDLAGHLRGGVYTLPDESGADSGQHVQK